MNSLEEKPAVERNDLGACGRRPLDLLEGRIPLRVADSGDIKVVPCTVCQRVCPNRNRISPQEEIIILSPSA